MPWVALWRAFYQTRKYSFLMISPKLHDISPFFLLIFSLLRKADFLILLRLPGDGSVVQQKIASTAQLLFFSKERNSELVSLSLNGLEQNSKCLLLFCSTERNSELFSLPRNGSERNSESFLFHRTAGIPPEQTNCSVYSVSRGIIFFGRKLPTHC